MTKRFVALFLAAAVLVSSSVVAWALPTDREGLWGYAANHLIDKGNGVFALKAPIVLEDKNGKPIKEECIEAFNDFCRDIRSSSHSVDYIFRFGSSDEFQLVLAPAGSISFFDDVNSSYHRCMPSFPVGRSVIYFSYDSSDGVYYARRFSFCLDNSDPLPSLGTVGFSGPGGSQFSFYCPHSVKSKITTTNSKYANYLNDCSTLSFDYDGLDDPDPPPSSSEPPPPSSVPDPFDIPDFELVIPEADPALVPYDTGILVKFFETVRGAIYVILKVAMPLLGMVFALFLIRKIFRIFFGGKG